MAAFVALIVLGIASVSEAHTFGAYGAGFGEGFLHPFGGLDHVLAMLGAGLKKDCQAMRKLVNRSLNYAKKDRTV